MSDGIGQLPFLSIPITVCWTGAKASWDGGLLRQIMNQAPDSEITSTCWSAWQRAISLSAPSRMILSMCYATLPWPAPAYVHCGRFVVSVPSSMRPIQSCCQPPPESRPASVHFSICRKRLPCCGVRARTPIGG